MSCSSASSRSRRRLAFTGLLALAILLPGCLHPAQPPGQVDDTATRPEAATQPQPSQPDPLQPQASAWPQVAFVLMGSQGTGDGDQFRVADRMEHACTELGCDAVLGLGGNLLPDGATGADDERFFTHFEDPYRDLKAPFWMALGEADHGPLGLLPSRADTQVAYAGDSDKWHMPARWYEIVLGPVQLIVLDSTALDGRDEVVAAQQTAWLDGVLAAPQPTPWRVAVFHHAPYSATPRLPDLHRATWLQEHLCDRVDLVLSASALALEWFSAQDGCGKSEFVVAGASAQVAAADAPDGAQPAQALFSARELGFWRLRFNEGWMSAEAVDLRHATLFERTLPRSAFYPDAPPGPPLDGCLC